MLVKFSKLNLTKCIYLNILFCFNRKVWCKWNIKRTWDMTPQQDLQFYRNKLDVQDCQRVIWEPYITDTLQSFPPVCGDQIWHAKTLLICFEIVNMHALDRVPCQFGLTQHIPAVVDQLAWIDHVSKRRCDWRQELSAYISWLNDQANELQSHRYPPRYS